MSSAATRVLALVDDVHHARKLVDAVFVLQYVDLDADEVLNELRRFLVGLHEDTQELLDLLCEDAA